MCPLSARARMCCLHTAPVFCKFPFKCLVKKYRPSGVRYLKWSLNSKHIDRKIWKRKSGLFFSNVKSGLTICRGFPLALSWAVWACCECCYGPPYMIVASAVSLSQLCPGGTEPNSQGTLLWHFVIPFFFNYNLVLSEKGQPAKGLPHKPKGLKSPEPMWKVMAWALILALGRQRYEVLWGSLVSQPSPVIQLQANERSWLKK